MEFDYKKTLYNMNLVQDMLTSTFILWKELYFCNYSFINWDVEMITLLTFQLVSDGPDNFDSIWKKKLTENKKVF